MHAALIAMLHPSHNPMRTCCTHRLKLKLVLQKEVLHGVTVQERVQVRRRLHSESEDEPLH